MSELFDHALRFARTLNPAYEPGRILPQKRPTTVALRLLRAMPVIVKVGYQPLPVYRQDGVLAKRQPRYVEPGFPAYAKLESTGEVHLYPFAMAGQGYEIVKDAEEGVHYDFDHAAIARLRDGW